MAETSAKTIQMMAEVAETIASDPCELLGDDSEQVQDCREESSHTEDWCVTCLARAAWAEYPGE